MKRKLLLIIPVLLLLGSFGIWYRHIYDQKKLANIRADMAQREREGRKFLITWGLEGVLSPRVTPATLAEYMQELTRAQALLQQAATLATAGDKQAAQAVLDKGFAGITCPELKRLKTILSENYGPLMPANTPLPPNVSPSFISITTARSYLDVGANAEAAAVLAQDPNDESMNMLRVQLLVQTEKPAQAAALLRRLLAKDRQPNYEPVRLMEAAGKGDWFSLLKSYYLIIDRQKLWGMMKLWQLPVPADKQAEKLLALSGKLPGPVGQSLAAAAIADLPGVSDAQALEALKKAAFIASGDIFLGRSDRFFRDPPLPARELIYQRRILQLAQTLPDRNWARMEICRLFEEECHYKEASAEYKQLMAQIENSETHASYAYYECRLVWPHIGYCQFNLGNYQAALQAFEKVMKGPKERSPDKKKYIEPLENIYYRAACLDAMKQYAKAVELYRQVAVAEPADTKANQASIPAAARLVDIYLAAGQEEELPELIVALPSSAISRLLHIRKLEQARDWPGLIDLLESSPKFSYSLQKRGAEYEALEIVRTLARHPDEFIPLVQKVLPAPGQSSADSKKAVRDSWLLYGLGLCGRPEATKILGDELKKAAWFHRQPVTNEVSVFAIVQGLAMSGPEGRALLLNTTEEPFSVFNYSLGAMTQPSWDFTKTEFDFVLPELPKKIEAKLPDR
jgi:tetratricopeptide (TPR) repeat protein